MGFLRILKGTFVTGTFLAGLALAAGAVGAQAGEYHVYSCRTPTGESAPVDGWSGSVAGPHVYAEDTCGQPGGALVAALGEEPLRTANTDTATWAFGAPAGETIAGATLWRAGDADGGAMANATYEFTLAGPSETEIFEECVYGLGCIGTGKGSITQPFSAKNRVVVPNANLGAHLYLSASCGEISGYKCKQGEHDAKGYTAVVYLYAADITLEQASGPSASDVSGELASAPAVRGTSDVAFDATDPGSGVYQAVFSVDGKVVQSSVLDEDGGRCRNVGQTGDGLAAFLHTQPCPGSVSVDVPFDTTQVSDGAHHLIVSVTDAAGNAAPVLDSAITVINPPPAGVPGPANGTNASDQATLTASWKGTTKAHATSGYGHSQAVIGRLTGPGGVPIGGAQIDLLETPAYAGAGPIVLESPRTAANGSFSVRLARSVSSGRLTFAYRSHLGDALAVATRTLTLSVRAGVTLSIAPRATSVGRSIFFKGQLHGAPLPAGGKQLVLEARSAGSGWIEFDVIRTGAKGRFHSSYRFKFPGPASYRFRVVSNGEADFPFATGSSNVVGVYER
jgi:hypothetical protein